MRRRERRMKPAIAAPGTAVHGPLQRKLGIACLTGYHLMSWSKPAKPNSAGERKSLPQMSRREDQLARRPPEIRFEVLRNEGTPCCLERRKSAPKKASVAARYAPTD